MYLGLDIGTSAVKALLTDGALRPLAARSVPLTVSSPSAYAREQTPEDWWRAVVQACQALAAERPADWARVTAIGLSGQMHGPVLLDRDGAVIRPVMLWNDGRAHAEASELARALPGIGAIAGVPPHPGFSAPKLMWLARHEPAAHRRIARICLPKDWIGMRLHGGFSTDMSDAAGTLWFDQGARAWSTDLARASATDPDWLPPLREGSDPAGALTAKAATELGLRPGLPVAAGGGDTAAGALGAGITEPGTALLSVGTSGQLLTAARRYEPSPGAFVHAFAHCLPGRWFRMAALLNGARPLAWFAEICGLPISEALAEAEAADPARAPLFLPYLAGERTPLADPHIRGQFFGLSDGTTRGQMMRAVVEGIAYGFAEAADALWPGPARPPALTAIGGGLRGDLFAQTMADVLGVRLNRAAAAETGPALGAARLAAMAAGEAGPPEPHATERAFDPDLASAPRHTQRRTRFRALYAALAPLSLP